MIPEEASFAELDASEQTVELMMPGGNWATFNFPSGSPRSEVNYRKNVWLEKVGSPSVTALILHYADGSTATYDTQDSSKLDYSLFYLSYFQDPVGNYTTYQYDSDLNLVMVSAADGTGFELSLDSSIYPYTFVTGVTTTYGATVSLTYNGEGTLTNIVDAAGISSGFEYFDESGGYVAKLVTPYGTTQFSPLGNSFDQGVFSRTFRITRPDGTQEFYGQMNSYTGNDWPDFSSSQIPTNTPIGTLDTLERDERNTFFWDIPGI